MFVSILPRLTAEYYLKGRESSVVCSAREKKVTMMNYIDFSFIFTWIQLSYCLDIYFKNRKRYFNACVVLACIPTYWTHIVFG